MSRPPSARSGPRGGAAVRGASAKGAADSRRLLTDRRLLERRRELIAGRVRRRRRQVLAGAILLVVGVGLYQVARSPLFGLSAVRVRGADAATRAAVLAAAGLHPGEPYLSIRLDAVRRRVAALPAVASVKVSRAYPSSLRITVVERRPAAVASSGSQRWLVAGDGTVLERASARPAGLPLVGGVPLPPGVRPGTRLPPGNSLANALAAVDGMDPALRRQVTAVTARSIDSLQFQLRGGALVIYGLAERQAAKDAAVLLVQKQLRSEGKQVVRIDVRSPSTPTVVAESRGNA
jgi:cell division protein FtsQ